MSLITTDIFGVDYESYAGGGIILPVRFSKKKKYLFISKPTKEMPDHAKKGLP